MSNDSAKWHWAEGIKYALEGIKLLFILNGASAVAILTFIGNAKMYSGAFVFSLVFFAFGSLAGIITMFLAYLTQLHYGNAEAHDRDTLAHGVTWFSAVRYHNFVYVCMGFGVLLFMLGVGCAAYGLYTKLPDL